MTLLKQVKFSKIRFLMDRKLILNILKLSNVRQLIRGYFIEFTLPQPIT